MVYYTSTGTYPCEDNIIRRLMLIDPTDRNAAVPPSSTKRLLLFTQSESIQGGLLLNHELLQC